MGLALYADKRTMEQRVRGIFGRVRTARFARILAVLLCLVVFVGCFTTACVPAREIVTDGNAKATDGNARATDGNAKATDGNAKATDGNASAAQPSGEDERPIILPPADPIGEFVKNLQPAAFSPITAPSRVIRNPKIVSGNVMLTYDASVTIPEASAYAVARMSTGRFSDEELEGLRKLFNVSEKNAEGQYSSGENGFYYCRYNAGVTRKTWVHYELDWQPEAIALFDDPILLTRAQTQPIAEKALADMGADGYVLDTADEAIAIGHDADGKPYAISKGWEYVYVPQSSGLPQHYYGGWFGGPNDPIFYQSAHMERIWLYVDEQGVSRVEWTRGMQTEETIVENVALISLDEAIALADERFARLYRHSDANFDIRVQNIRLAAMPLANSRDATEAYCVPVWEFEYSVAFGNSVHDTYRTICVLPFNAVDGGAVFAAEFPF